MNVKTLKLSSVAVAAALVGVVAFGDVTQAQAPNPPTAPNSTTQHGRGMMADRGDRPGGMRGGMMMGGQAVANGRMTQAQLDTMLASMRTNLAAQLNQKFEPRGSGTCDGTCDAQPGSRSPMRGR